MVFTVEKVEFQLIATDEQNQIPTINVSIKNKNNPTINVIQKNHDEITQEDVFETLFCNLCDFCYYNQVDTYNLTYACFEFEKYLKYYKLLLIDNLIPEKIKNCFINPQFLYKIISNYVDDETLTAYSDNLKKICIRNTLRKKISTEEIFNRIENSICLISENLLQSSEIPLLVWLTIKERHQKIHKFLNTQPQNLISQFANTIPKIPSIIPSIIPKSPSIIPLSIIPSIIPPLLSVIPKSPSIIPSVIPKSPRIIPSVPKSPISCIISQSSSSIIPSVIPQSPSIFSNIIPKSPSIIPKYN